MAQVRQTRSRGAAPLAGGLPETKALLEVSPKGKPQKMLPFSKPATRSTRASGAAGSSATNADSEGSANEEDGGGDDDAGEDDDAEDEDDAEDDNAPSKSYNGDENANQDANEDASALKPVAETSNGSWMGPPSLKKSQPSDMTSMSNVSEGTKFGDDFDSEAEGNAEDEEEEEAEFDVADDDDNYDDVDKISDGSDASDAYERELEREIMAAGEANIDWDDANTYAYDQAPSVNQYSMAIELALEHDSPLHPEFSYFEELRSPHVPSPTLSRDLSHQFGAAVHSHRRRLTFDSFANSDSSGSSSASSVTGNANDDAVTSSGSSSSAMDDDEEGSEDAGATTDEDEDPSDYEAVRPRVSPLVATPPTWIPNFPAFTSESRNGRINDKSSRSSGHRRIASAGHSRPLILRKLRLPSHKAVVQHVRTARGWTVRFELRGSNSLRWMSSPSSAASTPVTNARNSFDTDSAIDRYVSRAGFDDVLQGRLFQHRYCTPRNPQPRATPNFSRGYDLFSANTAWSPLTAPPALHHAHNTIGEAVLPPENALEHLIDLSAFDDDGASDRATPVPSDFVRSNTHAIESNGRHLDDPFDENFAVNGKAVNSASSRPTTSHSQIAGDDSSSIPATPSATPRKRRASETEDHTQLTPIFKRHNVRHSREIPI